MRTVYRTSIAENRRLKDLVIVLVLLVMADGLISRFLALSGLGQEINPLLRVFVGEGGFLLLKLAGALLAGVVLVDLYRRRPRVALGTAAFSVLLYTVMLYWNIAVLFIASGRGA